MVVDVVLGAVDFVGVGETRGGFRVGVGNGSSSLAGSTHKRPWSDSTSLVMLLMEAAEKRKSVASKLTDGVMSPLVSWPDPMLCPIS